MTSCVLEPRLSAPEQQESWDGEHSEPGGSARRAVAVDFHDLDAPLILAADLVDDRLQLLARPAPGRREIDEYRLGRLPLVVPVTLVRHYVRRLQVPYLLDQVYLSPHPAELMLLNHV